MRAGSEPCSANGYKAREVSSSNCMAFLTDLHELIAQQQKTHLLTIFQINKLCWLLEWLGLK